VSAPFRAAVGGRIDLPQSIAAWRN